MGEVGFEFVVIKDEGMEYSWEIFIAFWVSSINSDVLIVKFGGADHGFSKGIARGGSSVVLKEVPDVFGDVLLDKGVGGLDFREVGLGYYSLGF